LVDAARTSRVRLPESRDTRLLLAGIVAFLGLVVYLAVAYVNTHTTNGLVPSEGNKVAPWTASESTLIPVQRRNGKYSAWVVPATKGLSYGAVAQTLIPDPPRGRYQIGLWLKGARPGRIAVEVNEFNPGVARYPLQTSVPATRSWRHFTFRVRIKERWLGLAMYVYRQTGAPRPTWFAIRDVTASIQGR
jgi:hypothetical protein